MNDDPSPLVRLLLSYAPSADRPRHALLWALDRRLADVVRTTREPMLGRIRLTWWHDALTGKGSGQEMAEPLVASLVTQGVDAGDVEALVDGWEALLEPQLSDETLTAYADGRGRLFTMIAQVAGESEMLAGAGWALWDLSGHLSDAQAARRAVALAAARLAGRPQRRLSTKALRILADLARHDVIRGRPAAARLTVRQYLHILGLALRA